MTAAFVYLTVRSMWNRGMRRLRRLREPRYLAGLAVGLGYLYFFVLRTQVRATRRGTPVLPDAATLDAVPSIVTFVALALWIVSLAAWVWPSWEPPLKFTAAEVQFFYPAPVTRRQLLHYKLLRSQVGVVFGVLVAAIFSGAVVAAVAGRWNYVAGGLLLFTTFRLHLLGIAMTRALLRQRRPTVPAHAWLPRAIMAALSALVLAPLVVHAGTLAARGPLRLLPGVLELAQQQPAVIGLWPFAALVAPVFTPPGRAFLVALAPALGLLALTYWWVLKSDAVLSEAPVVAGSRPSDEAGPLPAPGARRAPFELSPLGRPELALLWKNLVLLGRYASPRFVVRVLLPVVVVAALAGTSKAGTLIGPLALVLAGFCTGMGPYMMRIDLRYDMPRLAVLKTWPVRGWSLVVGELLAPTLALSVLTWAALAVALAGSGTPEWSWASPADRFLLALLAALLAPMLIAAQLLIQNAAVVIFPGWVPTGGLRPRGIEAMGQQVLMLVATLLALVLGVLPAAAVAGGVGLVGYWFAGIPGLLPAGLVFVAILFLEAMAVVLLLGRVLERTDPTQVEGESALSAP